MDNMKLANAHCYVGKRHQSYVASMPKNLKRSVGGARKLYPFKGENDKKKLCAFSSEHIMFVRMNQAGILRLSTTPAQDTSFCGSVCKS